MKRKTVCLLLALLALLPGCQTKYYHETSSETLSVESLTDSVPPFVFGQTGFYDTSSDAEYLPVPEVEAKERGEEYFSDGERTLYRVEGLHESYFLMDEEGVVYKNAAMPWMIQPGEDGWADDYPALTYVG